MGRGSPTTDGATPQADGELLADKQSGDNKCCVKLIAL
jgi:hypothetical protein